MFKDKLKGLLQSNPAAPPAPAKPASPPEEAISAAPVGPARARQSNGLDQFFHSLGDREGLSVLDFAGASQANISTITNLGHRLYSEDFLLTLEAAFGGGDFYANQADPEKAAAFLGQTLRFPESSFDAALVWDSFQFLTQPMLQETVDRLYRILRPEACLLAFFHADERASRVPLYSYRIADPKTLQLVPRGERRPAQFFNNRSLERLFQQFQSVKFFLTRDALREVFVRR